MLDKEYQFIFEPRDIEAFKLRLVKFADLKNSSLISSDLIKHLDEKFIVLI
jgi:hypothetical protein